MEELLRVAAPFIAVAASAVGLLVAVDQLTQRSRMRRVAEWTKQLGEGESSEARIDALQRLRVMATARMVASVMVPPRFYLEATFMIVAVPFIVIGTYDETNVVVLALSGVGLSMLAIRRGIRVHLERYRIAAEYWRGVKVSPPQLGMLHQMEGGTRPEFIWALLLAVGLTITSLGAAAVVETPSSVVGLIVGICGIGLVAVGVESVRKKTPSLLHS